MPHYSASHYTASALMLKKKALSVKEIVAVVNALNDGQKNASVCEQFELSQSTVSTIWKNRSALLDAHKNGVTSAKRFRLCEKTDIDEALLQWFRRQSQIRTPISGTILKIKAEQFATMIGYTDFTGRLCGEAKSYPELIKCVDHLEQFIEATESADEGIFKAISVVRQFVKDHRPKLRQTTLKDFFQHKTLMRFHGASVSSASQGHYSEDHVVTIGIDSTSFVKQWQEVDQ
ncbi:Tigger transposable element-derived protein 4 [Trichinella pseudospiralis]|uniref:Tigger transposable element-derived protein 4 n=1 Tax=Trichinella pseudospiralis TaxID=6337 RepID=A0A0V0YKK8_TRIPS|nr:Tigger transposable element-derived protein 4 [Trichinella pseudospiralis]